MFTSLSPLLFNLKVLARVVGESGKKSKSYHIGKKLVKLLADDKIMYLENPKESIKKNYYS